MTAGAKLTICFSRPKGWNPFSRLIRWLTKSQVSHASLGVEVLGVPCILECTIGGVRFLPRHKFLQHSVIVEEYRTTAVSSAGLSHAIKDHLGDSYDYFAIPGYAYLLICARWFRKKVKNPLASPTALVCSEFVLHIDHEKKLQEWQDLDPERSTAQDVLARCRLGVNFERVL